MKAQLNSQQVRSFWTDQAIKHKTEPSASWSDVFVIELEIKEIGRRLQDGDRVLDVGCANGYATTSYARERKISIRGVDYIPEMIAHARERVENERGSLSGSIEFLVGDITALDEPASAYDKVVATRVVINLPDWETQRRALHELARVVRPGGILLLSEATLQGWSRLNAFRQEWELPPIPIPPFNLYLDENRVMQELSGAMQLLEIVNFASTYYVGTRVVKPLLAKALNSQLNIADPRAEWNRWFSAMPPAGDYGTQKLFVFKKN